MLRSTSGPRRVVLVLFALLLSVFLVLPKPTRSLLQHLGQPLAQIVAFPLRALAALDRNLREAWNGYVALRHVYDENARLHREIEFLRGQNSELREVATAGQRLAALLEFKEGTGSETIAAQVIGRDATSWYRALVLNKGERDGIRPEMGVMTQAGVVGRVVKANMSTAVVLLITDPNNAVTGLIQRTRDEGIVEGTVRGLARMKYIPLLSAVRVGDTVVTSGLTGGFPKGLVIGSVRNIERVEGDLFRSADITPEVDVSKLEEVLVISTPRPFDERATDAGSLLPKQPEERQR
ncbi:MAG: rod shape-determining protein MreC [Nitrospiraceae bacterium]